MFKKIFFVIISLFFVAILAAVGAFSWLVIFNPGEAMRRENIEKILAMESPVLYSDGQTKIGVFFQESHRQYISFEQLPKYFVDAITASEDQKFWRHYGVDFQGLSRAMIANLQAGRVIQGGSTITQQTAKNLFKRKDRSVKAKVIELINAWRLEYHYSKEKILEFYANQFFVSGNGHGLGVAARYYFDKSVADLGLLESAFIAGSVKRPNYYNPFIKDTDKSAAQARKRAKARASYVLSRMHDLGMINSGAYQQALLREIPFQQGRMQFPLNTIMDMVKGGMADPGIEKALFEHGVDNVATAGLRVVTTVDKDLQKLTSSALKSELSRLDVRLLGYDRDVVQTRYAALSSGAGRKVSPGEFLFGRILKVDPALPSVMVSLDPDDTDGTVGLIDKAGLMGLTNSLLKYEKQRWSEASGKDLPMLLERLSPGDLVYVCIREQDEITGEKFLTLEKYPELQGAALILQDGLIRAMAGGMENYFYNRAVSAKRSMGSVMKPLLYCAAIQLGWNSVDALNNERQMFLYQNQPYFPRPDHVSPHKKVSMSWAGVYSENVASVWLLYHLCDHLLPGEFKDMVSSLGLARKLDESYAHYKRRIRDRHGVIVNQAALKRAAFEKASFTAEADLIFASRQQEWEALTFFSYDDEFEVDIGDEDKSAEAELRRQILKKSFSRFVLLRDELKRVAATCFFYRNQAFVEKLYYQPQGVRLGKLDKEELLNGRSFIYAETFPGGGWQRVSHRELAERLAGLDEKEQQRFWNHVLIEGLLSGVTIDLVRDNFEIEYELLTGPRPYDPEVLYAMRDFRVLAGLQYLTGLCRVLGVRSYLDPVLSFPLGSNVISLLEAAGMYEGMVGGQFKIEDEEVSNGLKIISRIEFADGEVVYRREKEAQRVVDRQTSLAVSDILRNVVKYGTGRYASRHIRLHSNDPEKEELLSGLNLAIPLLGKTGTANRFTNSAFVGLLPSLHANGNGVGLADAHVLACYTGFDDNSPMTRRSTHLTGASGALPLWTDIANGFFMLRDYAGALDLVDLTFSSVPELPLWYPDVGQIAVPVKLKGGGIMIEERAGGTGLAATASVVTFGKVMAGGGVRLDRYYRPYWQNQEKAGD